MKVCLIGSYAWANAALTSLIRDPNVELFVLIGPEGPRVQQEGFTDSLELTCLSFDTPYSFVEDMEDIHNSVRELDPDMVVLSNCRTVLDRKYLSVYGDKTVNIHRGILPEQPGLSPIHWTILRGAGRSGVTAHVLSKSIDSGPILARYSFSIGRSDSSASIYEKQNWYISKIVSEVVGQKEFGGHGLTRHKRVRSGTLFRKVGIADREILWHDSATNINRKSRAFCVPFPPTYAKSGKKYLYFDDIRIGNLDNKFRSPGAVLKRGRGELLVAVGCGRRVVSIRKVYKDENRKLPVSFQGIYQL